MNSIKNYIQLTENFATAGQPRSEQFKLIAEHGYKHVVNIGMRDHPDAISNEDELVTEQGMSYIHIPVPFDSPSQNQLKVFCEILSSIRNDKVFIHCIMNFRVSAFMYHYLSKVEGLTDIESRSPIFDCWELEPAWEKLMGWSAEEIGLHSISHLH